MPQLKSSSPGSPHLPPRGQLRGLISTYDQTVPRYTSYPAVPYWRDLKPGESEDWLAGPPEESLSLYTHLPFCRERCTYCGCFVVITPHARPLADYVARVSQEMQRVRDQIAGPVPVKQYHLGGGTPTALSAEDLTALITSARELFEFDDGLEMSIEVDPRTVQRDTLGHLRALGFNRISLGVQDFDGEVQQRIGRVQPFGQVARVTEQVRALGFDSLNFDLIYGLPGQTPERFDETLSKVLALRPDRLALYSFAYLPGSLKHQRRIDPADLPDAETKLSLFLSAHERLGEAGYLPLGLDHFALESDELAVARGDGRLQRNFMGYTVAAGTGLLGFGVSAISEYGGSYWQNEKRLARYHREVDGGPLPAVKGWRLSPEDALRKDLISAVFCQSAVSVPELVATHGPAAEKIWAQAQQLLAPLAEDRLIALEPRHMKITPLGRFFLRNIAHAFDGFSAQALPEGTRFSRSV